ASHPGGLIAIHGLFLCFPRPAQVSILFASTALFRSFPGQQVFQGDGYEQINLVLPSNVGPNDGSNPYWYIIVTTSQGTSAEASGDRLTVVPAPATPPVLTAASASEGSGRPIYPVGPM